MFDWWTAMIQSLLTKRAAIIRPPVKKMSDEEVLKRKRAARLTYRKKPSVRERINRRRRERYHEKRSN